MIKAISVVTRREGVSREAFLDYWHEAAVEGAREVAGSKGFTLSYRVADEMGDAPYDGFLSLWFEDEAAARAAGGDGPLPRLAGAEACIDPSGIKYFLANEIQRGTTSQAAHLPRIHLRTSTDRLLSGHPLCH